MGGHEGARWAVEDKECQHYAADTHTLNMCFVCVDVKLNVAGSVSCLSYMVVLLCTLGSVCEHHLNF